MEFAIIKENIFPTAMEARLKVSKSVQNISLGLIGSTAVLIVGMGQRVQAANLSYAYAYQQISGLRFTNLSLDNIEDKGGIGFSFQPSVTSSASLTGQNTQRGANVGPLDVGQAYVSNNSTQSSLGLENNRGFFNGENFASQWNSGGNPGGNTDFSRSDAWIAIATTDENNENNYIKDTISPVPNNFGSLLTDILLGRNTSKTLLLGNVSESYVGEGMMGGGTSGFSISSTRFGVKSDTLIGVRFNYLNNLAYQLTNDSSYNLAIATADVKFTIQISEEKNSSTGQINPVPPLLFNTGEPNREFSTNDVENYKEDTPRTGSVSLNTGSAYDLMLSNNSYSLKQGKVYKITITSNAITNTQVKNDETNSEGVPEPSTILGASIAFGLGAVFKRRLRRLSQK